MPQVQWLPPEVEKDERGFIKTGASVVHSPYEYLSGALAACTAMTIQMYAQRKNWEVKNVTVHIDHDRKHALDCKSCENSSLKIDTFTRKITFEGNLSEEQKNRLIEIAGRCPVRQPADMSPTSYRY